jgi:hypothetical protein
MELIESHFRQRCDGCALNVASYTCGMTPFTNNSDEVILFAMLVNDFTNLMVCNDAPIIHWCKKRKNKTEEFCFYRNMLRVLSVPEFLGIVMIFIQIKYIKLNVSWANF